MSLTTLSEAQALRRGKRLVFTNGVFDLLHAGHVRYLAEARSLGDLMIVGINSDTSVRTLGKGPNRPVNGVDDRAEVLGALRVVDAVVVFDESTPERLIAELRPEVHVKGGDYNADDLPEAKIVRAYGGEIVIVPLVAGRSTTRTLRELGLE